MTGWMSRRTDCHPYKSGHVYVSVRHGFLPGEIGSVQCLEAVVTRWVAAAASITFHHPTELMPYLKAFLSYNDQSPSLA